MKRMLILALATLFAMQVRGQVFLNEGFEDSVFPPIFPTQWSTIFVSGSPSNGWKRNVDYAHLGDAHSGDAYIVGTWHPSGGQEDWLITTPLNVGTNDTLKFWAKCDNTNHNNTYLHIRVSTTTNDQSAFTTPPVLSLTNALDGAQLTNSYKQFKVPLNSYASQTIYIAFVHEDNIGWNIYLDDITGPALVLPACPNVFDLDVNPSTGGLVTVFWDTAFQDAGALGWNIAWDVAGGGTFDPTTAANTQWVSASDFPYDISGLIEGISYIFAMQTACGGAWTDTITVTVPMTKPVPYFQDFENLNDVAEWQFSNPTVNKWVIDTATGNSGNSVYISDNNGINNNYDTRTITYAAASALIDFGNFAEYELSFDWKAAEESSSDFMRIYIVPANYQMPVNGYPSGAGITQLGGDMNNGQNSWQRANFILSDIYSGTVQKLVFFWHNTDTSASQPPAAVDNISIIGFTCERPYNLAAENITYATADITWEQGVATNWLLYWSADGSSVENSVPVSGAAAYTILGLSATTQYNVRLRTVCGIGDTSAYSEVITFTTPERPCNAPNFTGNTVTDTSITITWQPISGENAWRIICRTSQVENVFNGITTNTYTIDGLSNNTNYQVCVVAICAPGIESSENCINLRTTSIHDIALANGVKLYPNPTSDKLIIEIESKFNTIEITNTLGQVIYRVPVTSNQMHVDVVGYSAGIYYVKLQGDNGIVTTKFVKK